MAQYDIPTPNTLLFRVASEDQAAIVLRMLAEASPGAGPLLAPARLFTLADVVSGVDVQPIAACAVARTAGSPDAWIGCFAVALPFRLRGMGRRLMVETVRALRTQGVRHLFVRIHADAEPMRRLLARAGVTSCAPYDGDWPRPAPGGEDGQPWSWLVSDL